MKNEALIDAVDFVEKRSDDHSCTGQENAPSDSETSSQWPARVHDLCLRTQTLCNEPFTTGRAIFLVGGTAIITYIICRKSSFRGMELLMQSNFMLTKSVEGIGKEVAKLVFQGTKKRWW